MFTPKDFNVSGNREFIVVIVPQNGSEMKDPALRARQDAFVLLFGIT